MSAIKPVAIACTGQAELSDSVSDQILPGIIYVDGNDYKMGVSALRISSAEYRPETVEGKKCVNTDLADGKPDDPSSLDKNAEDKEKDAKSVNS